MKIKVFFLTVLFAFPAFSYGETNDDENPKDSLYAMVGYTYKDIDGSIIVVPPEELAFTGDDIQSFNIATGEIVFTDNFFPNFQGFTIFLNDKPILESILVQRIFGASLLIFDLHLFFEWDYNNEIICRFYFCYVYPSFDINHLDKYDDGIFSPGYGWKEILAENFEKRKEGWELFIKYLSDNDKIIGNETAIDPPAPPKFNDISIYPNPTTGEFRVSGFEFRVADIQIFDIYGIKQFSTFNFQLSTQIDISHLPAGIYFVRITTEKGVVTKKVVKK